MTLKPGDQVYVDGRPDALTVEDASDPSLLTLKLPNGSTLKAGRATVERIEA